MIRWLVLSALLLSLTLVAAAPVATLTAGAGVSVNGKPLQTAGNPTWPLGSGDEVVTTTAPAVITFPDGSRVSLAPGTKIGIVCADRCVVQIFSGAVSFLRAPGSNMEMCALGKPVRPAEGAQGTVAIEGNNKVVVTVNNQQQVASAGTCSCNAGAPWAGAAAAGHAGHHVALIVVAAAGAAAAGTTIALTRGAGASTP